MSAKEELNLMLLRNKHDPDYFDDTPYYRLLDEEENFYGIDEDFEAMENAYLLQSGQRKNTVEKTKMKAAAKKTKSATAKKTTKKATVKKTSSSPKKKTAVKKISQIGTARKLVSSGMQPGFITGTDVKKQIPPRAKYQKLDEARNAMLPGYRVSRTGRIYYENRMNRSDTIDEKKDYMEYVKKRAESKAKAKTNKTARTKTRTRTGTGTSKAKTTSPKKTTVKKTATKKTAKSPPAKKHLTTKRMKKGIRAAAATKRKNPKLVLKSGIDKTPFTIDGLIVDNIHKVYIAHIKRLTGDRAGFVVTAKINKPKLFVEHEKLSLSEFERIWGKYIFDSAYTPARHGTPDEVKRVTAAIAAYGWKKADARKQYLKQLQKEINEEQAKDREEMGKARKKSAKEEELAKAIAYKLPTKIKQKPTVDTRGNVNINEGLAREANDSYSLYDYRPGSATAEYNSMIQRAATKVEEHKKRVDPMYWDKIDGMFEKYKGYVGNWLNKQNAIISSVPSWVVSGRSNYPTRKHEKQMAREDAHMEKYHQMDEYLQKILSVGNGGISSGDKGALTKIKTNLELRERNQTLMKAANAYYRKHGTLDGAELPADIMKIAKSNIDNNRRPEQPPFMPYQLQNNNAEIKRLRGRITQLSKIKNSSAAAEETYSWGKLIRNKDEMRLQLVFNYKPDDETRSTLKHAGFRWSPRFSAWQRLLNQESEYAFNRIKDKLED